MERRRDYKSLDEMAQHEGVERVLEFLAHRPTEIDGVYRHTEMKSVPYIVKHSDHIYKPNATQRDEKKSTHTTIHTSVHTSDGQRISQHVVPRVSPRVSRRINNEHNKEQCMDNRFNNQRVINRCNNQQGPRAVL